MSAKNTVKATKLRNRLPISVIPDPRLYISPPVILVQLAEK